MRGKTNLDDIKLMVFTSRLVTVQVPVSKVSKIIIQ